MESQEKGMNKNKSNPSPRATETQEDSKDELQALKQRGENLVARYDAEDWESRLQKGKENGIDPTILENLPAQRQLLLASVHDPAESSFSLQRKIQALETSMLQLVSELRSKDFDTVNSGVNYEEALSYIHELYVVPDDKNLNSAQILNIQQIHGQQAWRITRGTTHIADLVSIRQYHNAYKLKLPNGVMTKHLISREDLPRLGEEALYFYNDSQPSIIVNNPKSEPHSIEAGQKYYLYEGMQLGGIQSSPNEYFLRVDIEGQWKNIENKSMIMHGIPIRGSFDAIQRKSGGQGCDLFRKGKVVGEISFQKNEKGVTVFIRTNESDAGFSTQIDSKERKRDVNGNFVK